MRIGDLDRLKEVLERNFGHTGGAAVMRQLIDNAPTIDPVHAAGGCYCRECRFGRKPRAEDMQDGYVYCQEQSKYKELDDFCSGGEPNEVQEDGV